MVSDSVFAKFIADLEPATVPRRFITGVLYSLGDVEETLTLRTARDIDDFLNMHPRYDGCIGRGIMVDEWGIRDAIEVEVCYIQAAVTRILRNGGSK